MALSEDLPLYRDTLRLLNLLIPLSQGFPRFFRYNMGNRMIELNLDMCVWNSKSLQKGNMPGWPLSWIRSASRVQGGNNTVRKEKQTMRTENKGKNMICDQSPAGQGLPERTGFKMKKGYRQEVGFL